MESQGIMDLEYELVIEGDDLSEFEDKIPAFRPLTSISMELGMDEMLNNLHMPIETPVNLQKRKAIAERKKRGRKQIRPQDPVKKKTEEKDKYWLRSFRKYIKENFNKIAVNLSQEDYNFWTTHLSAQGVPDKSNIYSSYGRKYKNCLFSNLDFVQRFQQWFIDHGENEITRKYPTNSDLWFVFYDYGLKELFNYVPRGCSSLDSAGSNRSFSPQLEVASPSSLGEGDFFMIDADNEVMIESFLNQL